MNNQESTVISFAREMLSVADSLESAVNSSPQNKDELTDDKKFYVGVEMTLNTKASLQQP